jgi:hypothetical protein
MNEDPKLEERDDVQQHEEYEAPKIEVVGTVHQLTSEFDATEPAK